MQLRRSHRSEPRRVAGFIFFFVEGLGIAVVRFKLHEGPLWRCLSIKPARGICSGEVKPNEHEKARRDTGRECDGPYLCAEGWACGAPNMYFPLAF